MVQSTYSLAREIVCLVLYSACVLVCFLGFKVCVKLTLYVCDCVCVCDCVQGCTFGAHQTPVETDKMVLCACVSTCTTCVCVRARVFSLQTVWQFGCRRTIKILCMKSIEEPLEMPDWNLFCLLRKWSVYLHIYGTRKKANLFAKKFYGFLINDDKIEN